MPGTAATGASTAGGRKRGVRTMTTVVEVVVLLTVALMARPSAQLTLRKAVATSRPAAFASLDRKLEPEAAPTDNHPHAPTPPTPSPSSRPVPSTRDDDDEGSAALLLLPPPPRRAASSSSSASDSTTTRQQPPLPPPLPLPQPPPPQLRLAPQPGGASGGAGKGSHSSNARHSSRLKGPVVAGARELNTFPQQSAGPARSPTAPPRRHGPQHAARTAGAAALTGYYLSGGQASRQGASSSGGGSSTTSSSSNNNNSQATVLLISARPSRQSSSSADSSATRRPHHASYSSPGAGTRVTTITTTLQPRERRRNHRHHPPHQRGSTTSATSGGAVINNISGESTADSAAHRSRSRSSSSNSRPTTSGGGGGKTVVQQEPTTSHRSPASVPDQRPGGEAAVAPRAPWRRKHRPSFASHLPTSLLLNRRDEAVTSPGTPQHSGGGHKAASSSSLSSHRRRNHRNNHRHHHHNLEASSDSPRQKSRESPAEDKPHPGASRAADSVPTFVGGKKTVPKDHHHIPSSRGHRAKPIQVVVIPLGKKSSDVVGEERAEEVLLGIREEEYLRDNSLQPAGRPESLPHHHHQRQRKEDGTGEHHRHDNVNSVLQTERSELHPRDHQHRQLNNHQHRHQRQHQQHQAAAAAKGAPDVSRMVVTVVGSLTAILGACIMAAIFQCCCRRKRTASSGSNDESEVVAKKGAGGQQEDGGQQAAKGDNKQDGRKNSRSKSPSPQKVTSSNHDNHLQPDTGLTEQDKLLEDDPDVGDFSNVCRETEILRSYRKPPPPKNRARASRVPRALKTVDPKASPDIFKELVEKEQAEANKAPEPQPEPKETSVSPQLASRETSASPQVLRHPTPDPNDMHSSMLADIDNTLAAMHSTPTKDSGNATPTTSNPASARDSRRPSAEKSLSPSNTDNQLKPPTSKEVIAKSPSREELAKALAEQLSRSVSKEALASRLQGKTAPADSPKVADDKEPKAKSRSAGPSPKLRVKELTTSHSQDNIRPSRGGDSGSGEGKDVTQKNGNGGEGKKDAPKKSGNGGGSDIPKKSSGSGVKNTTVDVKNGSSAAASAAAEGAVANGDKKNGGGVNNASLPPEKEGGQDTGNIFALIDPTVKGEDDDKGKSKIPVRAASNPTQPIAPMRPGSGKEKRFPVPSVHGEQMDQLLKSLKTRLKEDGSSPKKSGNKVSPEGESADDDDLDPQGRNRSNSDPNRQHEEKKKNTYQTNL